MAMISNEGSVHSELNQIEKLTKMEEAVTDSSEVQKQLEKKMIKIKLDRKTSIWALPSQATPKNIKSYLKDVGREYKKGMEVIINNQKVKI